MRIVEIKAKKVFACAGSWALLAEAFVVNDDESEVYVMIQEYDGLEMTVSKKSVYGFLAGNDPEPEGMEFMEEYTVAKDAKGSAYAAVFDQLKKVIKMLG